MSESTVGESAGRESTGRNTFNKIVSWDSFWSIMVSITVALLAIILKTATEPSNQSQGFTPQLAIQVTALHYELLFIAFSLIATAVFTKRDVNLTAPAVTIPAALILLLFIGKIWPIPTTPKTWEEITHIHWTIIGVQDFISTVTIGAFLLAARGRV